MAGFQARAGGIVMSVPSVPPQQRDPADVAPADSYLPADPVWVYRGGGWRAGVIDAASARAVTATYRPGAALGTGVDTFTATYVLARSDTGAGPSPYPRLPRRDAVGRATTDPGATP
jgi:hypothetical protein